MKMNEKMSAEYWELNHKQFQFALEYCICFNATHAAINAGYSRDTAQEQGSRLLSHVMVSKALAWLIAERSERTMIDADWLLNRLVDEATADIADMYEADGVTLKPVHDWPKIWRIGLVAGIKIEPKTKVTQNGVEVVLSMTDVKISDRLKRLELIGKHTNVGAFTDKVDHSSSDGTMTPRGFNEFYDTPKQS